MHDPDTRAAITPTLPTPLYKAEYLGLTLILTLIMQVYIVSGGRGSSQQLSMSSTETLKKEGGSAWQEVASLPSGRSNLRGLGLDNGRFMVTGQKSSTR